MSTRGHFDRDAALDGLEGSHLIDGDRIWFWMTRADITFADYTIDGFRLVGTRSHADGRDEVCFLGTPSASWGVARSSAATGVGAYAGQKVTPFERDL
jgi:hypothetical protein